MNMHSERSTWAFAPRSFATSPAEFGRSKAPFQSNPVSGGEMARLRSAQLQHAVAFAVKQALAESSLKTYVESQPLTSGLSYVRLSRMIRGEVQMQIADVVELASRFTEVRTVMADPKWFGARS
jgi:hypothetical protein